MRQWKVADELNSEFEVTTAHHELVILPLKQEVSVRENDPCCFGQRDIADAFYVRLPQRSQGIDVLRVLNENRKLLEETKGMIRSGDGRAIDKVVSKIESEIDKLRPDLSTDEVRSHWHSTGEDIEVDFAKFILNGYRVEGFVENMKSELKDCTFPVHRFSRPDSLFAEYLSQSGVAESDRETVEAALDVLAQSLPSVEM